MQKSSIVLTDQRPLVDPDGKCPRCRADESRRVLSSGFGTPHEVCANCAYEFPPEDARG